MEKDFNLRNIIAHMIFHIVLSLYEWFFPHGIQNQKFGISMPFFSIPWAVKG